MDIDINDDPSLPDWDGDAELTPWQQMRARVSMDWACVVSDGNGLRSMEACERAARVRRLRMTPRERADDNRARMRVADLNRALRARDTREYLQSQGWKYGLINPDPTHAEALAAWRVRNARRIGMDEQALRQDMRHEDHDGFDPDELLDPEAIAAGCNAIDRACDLLERRLAERPLTYAEILAAHRGNREALLARDGLRVYHVLAVGDDDVHPDAEARMPAATIANPPRDPLYDKIRCRSDEATLGDMLWPDAEARVECLREVVAEVTGTAPESPATDTEVETLVRPDGLCSI